MLRSIPTSIILTMFFSINLAHSQAGIAYYLDVDNPVALVQALDTLNNSPEARSDNVRVALSLSVAS